VANAGSSGDVAEQLPTLITKLKSAGVTTLVMFSNNTASATASKAMSNQDWFPEVVVTSYPYDDLDILAQSFDQEVWSHAFGLVWFLPYVNGQTDVLSQAFQWYWHRSRHEVAAQPPTSVVCTSRHMPGPNLTKKAVEKPLPQAAKSAAPLQEHVDVRVRASAQGEITPRAAPSGGGTKSGKGNFHRGWGPAPTYLNMTAVHRRTLPRESHVVRRQSVQSFTSLPASASSHECKDCPSTGAHPSFPAEQDLNL
jgi:hypothetical protein